MKWCLVNYKTIIVLSLLLISILGCSKVAKETDSSGGNDTPSNQNRFGYSGNIGFINLDENPASGATDEWIEVHCHSATDMTGWYMEDASSHVYYFPSGFILGNASAVKVYTKTGTNSSTELYQNLASAIWNNDHDTASLYNPSGNLIHQVTY